MDIEQFFTDILIHGRDSQKTTLPSKPTSESFNMRERDITSIYGQLRQNFDKDTLKLPQQEAHKILSKFMNSSRIIRFPKIYQNQRELHVQSRRKRLSSHVTVAAGDTIALSKDEVFVMDYSPSNKHIGDKQHIDSEGGTSSAIKLQLQGRSHSTTKVVVLEQKQRPQGDYISLSKEYRSKLLSKDVVTTRETDEFQKKYSVPDNKIYFDNTIETCGPRLHAHKAGEQSMLEGELPQIAPHQINPRLTRHGYSNDPAAMAAESFTFEPLGGRTIAVVPSPVRLMHQPRSLPHKDKGGALTQRKHRPIQKTIKDIKIEYQPLMQSDFTRLVLAYNYLQIRENRQGMYKAYIGRGNNSVLVKKALKARGYWAIAETCEQDVNFLWTQTRNNKFFEQLQPRKLEQFAAQDVATKRRFSLSPLVEQFMEEKLSENIFVETVEALLSKEMLPPYLNQMIREHFRRPRQPIDGSNLSEFLTVQRGQKYQTQIIDSPHSLRLHNHVDSASALGNKKGLLFFMKRYYEMLGEDPFQVVPETVHLKERQVSEQLLKQTVTFGLPCILKPGESTNRGKGITVHTTWPSLLESINRSSKHDNGEERTHIIQRYVMPFLYNNRKFDIRVWVLWSGRQAWWYKQGYIRTSSKEFSIKSCSKYVHLTNDAIQKYSEDYGRFEPGNKISFNEFQKYVDHTTHGRLNFWEAAYPQMKKIARDVFRVGNFTMDTKQLQFGYQLFGLDFMIDENFKVWLIEANTNPCLETSCSILTRLITNMIDNVVSIAVDPLFPPPASWKKRAANWSMESFKFELLYDGHADPQTLLMEDQVKFETEEDEFEEKEETPK